MKTSIGDTEFDIGSSIFWILLILISLGGLIYLLIWSFHNNSVKGAVISTIFAIMIMAGVLLSRLKIFDLSTWGDNALSFTLGFTIWIIIGSIFGQQSVLSVSQNHLFATIASELPQVMEFVVNNLVVPIAEELFWMIGIPFALISIMKQIGKKVDLFDQAWFQMVIVVLISASTFAIFHVGKAFTAFIIAAIIFRTIMIVLVYGDYNWDILKGVNLVAGFSVGAHIANNIIDTGFQKSWLILQTNIPLMIGIVVLFGFIFISALNRILRFVMGKTKDFMSD